MAGIAYTVVLFVVLIGVMYFLMIRPQRKRAAEHESLMKQLKQGDRVITVGGIHGGVDKVDEKSVVLKLEDGAKMRVSKT